MQDSTPVPLILPASKSAITKFLMEKDAAQSILMVIIISQ